MHLRDMDAASCYCLHVHRVDSTYLLVILEQCFGHSVDIGWAQFAGGHPLTEHESLAGHTRCRAFHSTSSDRTMDHRDGVLVHSPRPQIQEHPNHIAVQFSDAIIVGHVAITSAHTQAFPSICSHHAFSTVENRSVEFVVWNREDRLQRLSACEKFRHEFRSVSAGREWMAATECAVCVARLLDNQVRLIRNKSNYFDIHKIQLMSSIFFKFTES